MEWMSTQTMRLATGGTVSQRRHGTQKKLSRQQWDGSSREWPDSEMGDSRKRKHNTLQRDGGTQETQTNNDTDGEVAVGNEISHGSLLPYGIVAPRPHFPLPTFTPCTLGGLFGSDQRMTILMTKNGATPIVLRHRHIPKQGSSLRRA